MERNLGKGKFPMKTLELINRNLKHEIIRLLMLYLLTKFKIFHL